MLELIAKLISNSYLSIEKAASLFGAVGVTVNDFSGLLNIKTKDDMNELIKMG